MTIQKPTKCVNAMCGASCSPAIVEMMQALCDNPQQCPCYEYNPNLLVETCRNIAKDYADVDQFVCSECGIELQDWNRVGRDEDNGEESFYEYTLKYCPNCGRRIEYDC
jgi:DNA-directed RNA polymerase subunit RPC12/RpoP